MELSVQDFMAQQKPAGRRSKLEPFKKDILLLAAKGYTLDQILEFLNKNNMQVSKTALHHFVTSRQREETPTEPASVPSIQSEKNKPVKPQHHGRKNTAHRSDARNNDSPTNVDGPS